MKKRLDVWLSRIMGVNCVNGLQFARSGLTPREIYHSRKELEKYNLFTESQIDRAAKTDIEDIEPIYRNHIANGIESINRTEENFPERLKNIANMPVVLFYKGDLSLLESRYTVAVIGSRHCSGEGEKACEIIAGDIGQAGGVVVSGLAQGIDTIAHKSCVEAGGKTIAFTGVPLDEYFPKSNENFQKKLEKEHLVISEYHSGFRYYSSNFIHRNRLIALTGDALCVIQAKKKSGSLATVKRALEYDKPVFTVPGSIFRESYEGSNRLLIENRARAVSDGKQIMEYLGAGSKSSGKKKLPEISDMAKQTLAVITKPMFTSAIVKATPLPPGLVKAAVTELEISGYITKTRTGEYIKTTGVK